MEKSAEKPISVSETTPEAYPDRGKSLLPMTERERKRSVSLPMAARLRLDHGVLAALLMVPLDRVFRTVRAMLDMHNPLEEVEGGVYEQCESLAGPEIDELVARIAETQRVPVSSWIDSPRVLAAARRALACTGHDPALLNPT